MSRDGLPRGRSRFSLRRLDSCCVVEVDGTPTVTVQERLEQIGPGKYQYLLLTGVGGALMSECFEMGAVAPLHTALAREFSMSSNQRTSLPLLTYLGAAVGLFVAGPISDRHGRKFSMLLSLILITALMLIMAALPAATPPGVVMLLRFCSGLVGAIQVPAGQALAAESCYPAKRASLFFQIGLLGAFGYFLESFGVKLFMPHFGEDPADSWRNLCLVTACAAGVMVAPVLLLSESPSFYAVKGDANSCVAMLDNIARTNGQLPLQGDVQVEQSQDSSSVQDEFDVKNNSLMTCLRTHWPILLVLIGVDSFRSFFVAGSSYLWKDLFMLAEGSSVEPSKLNMIASLAPMVGIMLSEPLLFLGVRKVAVICACISALAFAALTRSYVCLVAMPLLVCVITIKLTMAPMSTCVGLIKAEMFPTEIRVSAYSMISIFAKVATILAPTLTEEMRGGATATHWSPIKLQSYVFSLMVAAILSGLLLLLLPEDCSDGGALHDFITEDRILKASNIGKYGSVANVWELARDNVNGSSDPSAEMSKFSRRGLKNSKTEPVFNQTFLEEAISPKED